MSESPPRAAWRLLRDAFGLYLRLPWLLAALGAIVVVPFALVLLAVGASPFDGGKSSWGLGIGVWAVELALITPLIAALHVHAVRAIRDGEKPRFAGIAAAGIRVLPLAGATSLLAALGSFVALFAFVVPGVLLWLRWSVSTQSAALEATGVRPALHASRSLTDGAYWQILLLYAAVSAITFAIGFPLHRIFSGAGPVSFLVGAAWSTVSRSFEALATSLLFFDLRDRRPWAADGTADFSPLTGPTPSVRDTHDVNPAARPDGNPLDPRSYPDATRPRGWWVDPDEPRRMRFWGLDDSPTWSNERSTPRKLRRAWWESEEGEARR